MDQHHETAWQHHTNYISIVSYDVRPLLIWSCSRSSFLLRKLQMQVFILISGMTVMGKGNSEVPLYPMDLLQAGQSKWKIYAYSSHKDGRCYTQYTDFTTNID